MSTVQSNIGQVVENADIDRDTPQPEIHVEERRLSLHDFLKTAVKINGSDIHLQAGSIPMIRVDGRARFLDCPPLTDEAMKEYVDQIIDQAGRARREAADPRAQGRGRRRLRAAESVARFRTNIFHSRERYAIVMRRIVTKIPNFDELNLPPQIEKMADYHRGIVIVSGTTGSRQIHHAGGHHRQDQPHARRANHHRRRPDRIPARERQEPGQPGRSRAPTARATNTPCAR